MRLVLDSNVIVAAFAARGLCQALFEVCLVRHRVVVSEEILEEVRRAFVKKLHVPRDRVDATIAYLRSIAECSTPAEIDKNICRDGGDAHILGLALAANVECIVSGDQDLITLENIRGIPILSPRTWWERESK